MRSPVVKRSVVIAGHKTSVSLEDAFWRGLKEIAVLQGQTLSDLVADIDQNRDLGNLSSAIRLYVLEYYRERANRRAEPVRPALLPRTPSTSGSDQRIEDRAPGQS